MATEKEMHEYLFQLFPNNSLVKLLNEKTNLKVYIRKELASRGLDKFGNWVGFDKAKKHHKIK